MPGTCLGTGAIYLMLMLLTGLGTSAEGAEEIDSWRRGVSGPVQLYTVSSLDTQV
jgi:hypothetical protein